MNIWLTDGVPLVFCMLATLVGPFARAVEVGPVELHWVDGGTNDATVRPADAGAVEVRTTGGDPYVFLRPPDGQPLNLASRRVLEFEYFSTARIAPLEVRLDPVPAVDHLLTADGLGRSEGWSRRTIDLAPLLGGAADRARGLRLDLGQRAGRVIQIRGVRLRPLNDQERILEATREERRHADAQLDDALRGYLRGTFPCQITRVTMDGQRVNVEGRVSGERDGLFLAAAAIEVPASRTDLFQIIEQVRPAADGRFTIGLDRQATRDGSPRDRLLDRWAVVHKRPEGGVELRSHFRYADDVTPSAQPAWPTPRGKKGLGALWRGRPLSDLDDLGVSWATVNVVITGLFRTTPAAGCTPFEASGRTWYADDRAIAHLDHALLEAAKRQITVSAILLVGQAASAADPVMGKLLAHPDADPAGIYVMPNLTTRDGVAAYAATLEFLARRYSRPDGQFGRVHHWILHNEVDAGWVWTNAGEKTATTYTDLYQRSMRMAHLIARQYDPRAKAFTSLTHYWAKPGSPRFYASRELLDLLLEFSAAEGDFDWAIAHHPYPQNLGNPRVWADTKVDFTLDTPLITFKNIEVLDAWVRQPRAMYLGRHLRTVHLTEQGLNSRDYSPASLRDQAAGMAYAWSKIKDLPTIEAFHYHNWVDNRGEGGLRIGLRRFPDDKDDPEGKKPIWDVYRAAGTAEEPTVFEQYKSVVGVKDWPEVRYRGEIK
jgi:hypothetical protein